MRVPVDGAPVTEPPPPPDETEEDEPPPPPPEDEPPPVDPPPVGTGMRVKVAVTDLAEDMVATQVPVVLVHAPDQPEKVESALGVAVRDMTVPDVTDMEQVVPQLRPLPVMVPLPDLVAVTVYVVTGTAAVVTVRGLERDELFPAASYADTVKVYAVLAVRPVTAYELVVGEAI